jgi:hypothetical protein
MDGRLCPMWRHGRPGEWAGVKVSPYRSGPPVCPHHRLPSPPDRTGTSLACKERWMRRRTLPGRPLLREAFA